ncbi:Belongs to the binding-protein-dependent transport system permease family [Vibrio sp. B1ASS3]|uniref:ribose ABC transporter permease n=1 Tax=Vibrio sp. B1ASS3 TaxID=2751176 RepID=UPI001ABB45E4|nr:ribose ABC transporter permease [Vibrio sp. B1ASS3]CAD7826303.1 Belongs to the binding-protein-dependent transport system permease family [Vibrio sp. B1ASS3]CAE6960291.1 Belongs to the binding-protein-dependent transport system permease family [Vibrio sp. B1ASS3]
MSTKTMSKPTEANSKKLFTKEWLIEQKSLIALIFLIVVVSFLNPNFFTVDNILNILRQTSVNAIIAVGMTLVILTAGIDLSVGSVLALCGAFAASMIALEVPVLIAVPTALFAGAALGAISGIIIAKGKVQAFIATLVTMTLLRGVTMVYTDGRPISTGFTDTADAFAWFGTGYALGIPVPVWLMVIVFAAAWYLLNHTRFGRYVYALGGNESATRLSSAQPTAGMGYELDAIAAVVLGGTSLMGGKGRIMGTLIGALIIGFLNNALNLLDVSSYYQMIAKAVVILLAVLVDNKNK